jgi:hypothetical protein
VRLGHCQVDGLTVKKTTLSELIEPIERMSPFKNWLPVVRHVRYTHADF